MPRAKKPAVHFSIPIKRIEQTTLDSRQLGPCDAFYKLAHKTKMNTFKVTTRRKGKEASHRSGEFRLSPTGKGDARHAFSVRLRQDGQTVLTGAVQHSTRLPKGTVVAWHNDNAADVTVTVEGVADDKKFTNKKMNHHEGFSHVFLTLGVFKYHNGMPGNKRKRGQVTVKRAPEPNYLTKGHPVPPVLVECKADGFHPDKVEIVVGQAVGWIVFENGTCIIGQDS